MHRRKKLLVAAILLALAMASGVQGAGRALPARVTIGLSSTPQASLTLFLPAGTVAAGPAGPLWQAETDTTLALSLSAEGVVVAGALNLGPGPLRFQSDQSLLGWGSRLYRGNLLVLPKAGGLQIANELALEDYLRGVLPAEVSPLWPAEVLKAQAVAARTYTIARLGYHRGVGYDLCASTHCQVYAGAGAEKPATDAAVTATEGQVITYGGRLISAYYHASSGGHTEDVESVWTGASPLAYLRGVPDPAESSPYEQWRVELDWGAAESAVAARYPEAGRLLAVNVLGRTAAGRALQVELVSERGTVKINGEGARTLFSLQSSLFDLQTEYGPVPVPSPDQLAYSPIYYALAPTAAALWYGVLGEDWQMAPVKLIFSGRGWGHGVGLSQWGAKALAEMGYTYVMILKYYYQGTEVEDWRPTQALPPGQGLGEVAADAG